MHPQNLKLKPKERKLKAEERKAHLGHRVLTLRKKLQILSPVRRLRPHQEKKNPEGSPEETGESKNVAEEANVT